MSTVLRENFTRYLITCRYADKTVEAYINAVYGLAAFHMKSPDTLSNDEIQEYLYYLIEVRKLTWSTCNVAFSALQCFFGKFLRRDETSFTIPPRKRSRKFPVILSQAQTNAFLNSITNLKHRTLLLCVYSAGLRVREAVALKPHHIESDPDRMMIRVEQGKGRKDRYTLLSRKFLHTLKQYQQAYPPKEWIFFGRNPHRPMPVGTAQKIYYNAKKKPA